MTRNPPVDSPASFVHAAHPRSGGGGVGAILLELLLAVAIFSAAGLAILSVMNTSIGSARAMRDAQQAADLARSAMAKIEAGIATPETLHGPVPAWVDEVATEGAFADAPPTESNWELEVTTDRSQFAGLTLVTVRALRRESPNSDQLRASYTLRQLVRLFGETDDAVGDEDEMSERARRWTPAAGTERAGQEKPEEGSR